MGRGRLGHEKASEAVCADQTSLCPGVSWEQGAVGFDTVTQRGPACPGLGSAKCSASLLLIILVCRSGLPTPLPGRQENKRGSPLPAQEQKPEASAAKPSGKRLQVCSSGPLGPGSDASTALRTGGDPSVCRAGLAEPGAAGATDVVLLNQSSQSWGKGDYLVCGLCALCVSGLEGWSSRVSVCNPER